MNSKFEERNLLSPEICQNTYYRIRSI